MYELEASLLSEKSAVRVSFTGNPQTGDIYLVRGWHVTRPDLQASLMMYLMTIKEVENPMADGCVYPGRWKVVPLSQLPQTPRSEGEPMIKQGLKYIDGTGGSFTWASKEAMLHYSRSIMGLDLPAPMDAFPIPAVQGLISESRNTFDKDDMLYRAVIEQTYGKELRWERLTGRTFSKIETTAGIRNAFDIPEATFSQGEIEQIDSTVNEDGTYDVVIRKVRSIPRLVSFVQQSTILNDVQRYEYFRYNEDTLPVESDLGVLREKDLNVQEDGTYDIILNEKISKPLHFLAIFYNKLHTRYDIMYQNWREGVGIPATGVQGVLYSGESRINPDGTYDINLRADVSSPVGVYGYMYSPLSYSYTYRMQNSREIPFIFNTNRQVQFSILPTTQTDGTYDIDVKLQYNIPYVVPRALPYQGYQKSVVIDYIQYPTLVQVPDVIEPNKFYDIDIALTEEGLYRGRVLFQYSYPAIWYDEVKGVFSSRGTSHYLNYPIRPSLTMGKGWEYRIQSTLNKDWSFNIEANFQYTPPAYWYVELRSPARIVDRAQYLRYHTNPLTNLNLVPGQQALMDTVLNEDGTYTVQLDITTMRPAWYDLKADLYLRNRWLSVIENYNPVQLPIINGVRGYDYNINLRYNENGTVGGFIMYDKPKDVSFGVAFQLPKQWFYEGWCLGKEGIPSEFYQGEGILRGNYDINTQITDGGLYNFNYTCRLTKEGSFSFYSINGALQRRKTEIIYGIPYLPTVNSDVYSLEVENLPDGTNFCILQIPKMLPWLGTFEWFDANGRHLEYRFKNYAEFPSSILSPILDTINTFRVGSVNFNYDDLTGLYDVNAQILDPIISIHGESFEIVEGLPFTDELVTKEYQFSHFDQENLTWVRIEFERHEKAFKKYSDARQYIKDAESYSPENVSVTPIRHRGRICWLAVYYIRKDVDPEYVV